MASKKQAAWPYPSHVDNFAFGQTGQKYFIVAISFFSMALHKHM